MTCWIWAVVPAQILEIIQELSCRILLLVWLNLNGFNGKTRWITKNHMNTGFLRSEGKWRSRQSLEGRYIPYSRKKSDHHLPCIKHLGLVVMKKTYYQAGSTEFVVKFARFQSTMNSCMLGFQDSHSRIWNMKLDVWKPWRIKHPFLKALSSLWFQTIWKISVKIGNLPQVGVNIPKIFETSGNLWQTSAMIENSTSW